VERFHDYRAAVSDCKHNGYHTTLINPGLSLNNQRRRRQRGLGPVHPASLVGAVTSMTGSLAPEH